MAKHGTAPTPTARLVKTLAVTCHGNATASQLRKQGEYDWFNRLITNDRFPMVPHAPILRTIELLQLDHNWSYEEGLVILADRNLDRPTSEDCFYFGIQHPDEQRAHPLVFSHEPVLGLSRLPSVLVLYEYNGDRELDLDRTACGWPRGCALVGVCKVA